MNRCTAALLLLVIAVYSLNTEAYKCRCTRKGPKIRYKDVQKLEIKPKHPYCQEKMIFVTMENVSRFKGQEYCLHPRLQSTKNLVKWFKIWKDKHRLQLNPAVLEEISALLLLGSSRSDRLSLDSSNRLS
ncbi:C-X-C motif chemokine 14 [Anabarilius grahami]|uniref:C-X-C motif chemokine 14 n=1 Tax=Anabarilius grahami TaxID=495550 RepID=A0A3N0ZC01_ANAGA|nr:C-X-C motif chemokine 14 [Anabarilius grahami]